MRGMILAKGGIFMQELEQSKRETRAHVSSETLYPFHFPGVTGESIAFRNVLRQAAVLAPSGLPVHLTGETGTGKDLLAKAIHLNSPRRNRPYVEVNCGALPENLLASELFGYVPGAFTGAGKAGAKGKFAAADGGTLFLDEIGEMPEAMQKALLKVLDHGRFLPVGADQDVACDVRIVTATNQDLRTLVQLGCLRADLYYRLYVSPLFLPPLRDRREDIWALIAWYKDEHDWNAVWTDEHLAEMTGYDWPGNVRQLLHTLERLRIFHPQTLPPAKTLRGQIRELDPRQEQRVCRGAGAETASKSLTYREQLERDDLKQALAASGGRVQAAMKLVGMPRSTFYRKIKKYGLD
ncbi:sigma 54-interacting transcriptional regulator [Salisediminibacterium halotolerans]|uniref:sigma 54-interacting transcriptional regulator n=1 Tax=Salisediminibacterium halotolerans TaxID=517425 RepID=UPI000EB0AED4|nr:sigma 54-interacting transcriptional regulator [Salisediminibacterium halotolerans]RPE89432.1 regulatory Fis family protein [Salisediminibacterium halotolerans]